MKISFTKKSESKCFYKESKSNKKKTNKKKHIMAGERGGVGVWLG